MRWTSLLLVPLLTGCIPVRTWQPLPVLEAEAMGVPEQDRARDRYRVTVDDGLQLVGHLRAVDREGLVLQEKAAPAEAPPVRVPWDRVTLLEFRDENHAATLGTTVTVWTAVAAGAITGLVILLKGSCPFIYARDADGREILLGEGYSGSIGRGMAREDLLRVPVDDRDHLELVITNESPHENQRTDLAELLLVDLPDGGEPIATHDAGVIVTGPARSPVAAVDQAGVDQLSHVVAFDRDDWRTDLDVYTPTADRVEALELSFDPVDGPAALVLDGRNTLWADKVSGRMWATVGPYLGRVMRSLEDPRHPEEVLAFRERAGLDLRVQVRADGVWSEVAVVPFLGWASTKRVAVPLPPSEGPVEVRIEGGPGFWRVDRAALAPVIDASPDLQVVPLAEATTSGHDERHALAYADGVTADLPELHDETALRFDLPRRPDAAFLRLNGHYLIEEQPRPHTQLGVMRDVLEAPERMRDMSLQLWMLTREALAAGSP